MSDLDRPDLDRPDLDRPDLGGPAVVAAGAELAATPGLDGTVAVVVTGGAGGEARLAWRLVDGRPVEVVDDAGVDLTLTLPVAEAAAMARGELDPSVAFMRGRLKTAGDNGLVLRVLAAAAAPGFGPWLARLAGSAGPTGFAGFAGFAG